MSSFFSFLFLWLGGYQRPASAPYHLSFAYLVYCQVSLQKHHKLINQTTSP
ncbi:hypothetical protein ACB098_02G216800 [Castanea mollissima]